MTTFKILSAAAILSAAIATPALAQEVIYNPGYCAQFYPNANCQNKGANNPYTGDYQARRAYRSSNNAAIDNNGWDNGNWNDNRSWNASSNDDWNWGNDHNDRRQIGRNQVGGNGWNNRDTGFWPGDVAANVVGGAVNTAGAIASAPFRGSDNNSSDNDDSFAMDDSGNAASSSCAQRYRSFDPASGTFLGYDGKRHACQ